MFFFLTDCELVEGRHNGLLLLCRHCLAHTRGFKSTCSNYWPGVDTTEEDKGYESARDGIFPVLKGS